MDNFNINGILPFFSILFGFLINILPSSPFQTYLGQLAEIPWLNYLNWFFPVGECIVVMQTWLICYGTILTYKVVMRYIKIL